MFVNIRGCTFIALAFAAFFWKFGKTQAIHMLEPADANVVDGGDMCQCGPRCAGYVDEHICARCCTSVMRRRRRSTNFFFTNYSFVKGSTSSNSIGVEDTHAHRQRGHPKFSSSSMKHHNHSHNQIIHQNVQKQQQKLPPYMRGFWRCALFKICPEDHHHWHMEALALLD